MVLQYQRPVNMYFTIHIQMYEQNLTEGLAVKQKKEKLFFQSQWIRAVVKSHTLS